MRRRLVETVRPADDAHPLSTSESQTAHENVRNILVEEGHRVNISIHHAWPSVYVGTVY